MADGAGIEQALGLFRIGRQMQIGEQRLARLQPRDLDRLRFLDLHDHVGGCRKLRAAFGRIFAPARTYMLVGQADGVARLGLDEDLVAARASVRARRRA